jgi:hypothetical protein
MKLFKHMEVVLMLAFCLVCATAALQPTGPATAVSKENTAASQPTDLRSDNPAPAPMPVVHVIGRRLTSEEKRAAVNAG